MEIKNITISPARKRKLMLVLPVVVLPLLTFLFWLAGGGSTEKHPVTTKEGFNIKLPNANNKENVQLSKFNYYENAALDSSKVDELRKKDPNYVPTASDSISNTGVAHFDSSTERGRGLNMATYDPAEEKLVQRLELLKKTINAPPKIAGSTPTANPANPTVAAGEIQRLEKMMRSVQTQEPEDREMQQINGMLENILDIQYPQRLQEKMKKSSEDERGVVFPVQKSPEFQPVSLLEKKVDTRMANFGATPGPNKFYTLEDQQATPESENAVQASIAEAQTIVNGATVKMKLGQDIYINGIRIPANTFIYGMASLKGERLSVKVSSIRYGNSLFPVDLSVHDLDGLDGLFIPGAINREVAKASADQSLQSLGITTMDDSWGSQAAGAGVEAAKSLFSKKVKLVKVVVKSGYQVLLWDKKQKDKS